MKQSTKDHIAAFVVTYSIVAIFVMLMMLLSGCKTKYITVPEVHERYVCRTDTVERIDSFIDRQTTVIREVDSAALAEFGIQLRDAQRAWLIDRSSLLRQASSQRVSTADTIIVHDTIPAPVIVEKPPQRATGWAERLYILFIILAVVTGGVMITKSNQKPD